MINSLCQYIDEYTLEAEEEEKTRSSEIAPSSY